MKKLEIFLILVIIALTGPISHAGLQKVTAPATLASFRHLTAHLTAEKMVSDWGIPDEGIHEALEVLEISGLNYEYATATPPPSADCVIPEPDQDGIVRVENSTVFCAGDWRKMVSKVEVIGDSVTISSNNYDAVFNSIKVSASNTTVSGIMVVGHGDGIVIEDSADVSLRENFILDDFLSPKSWEDLTTFWDEYRQTEISGRYGLLYNMATPIPETSEQLGGYGIMSARAKNLEVEGNVVILKGQGINLGDAPNPIIRHNVTFHNGNGISTGNADAAVVEKNYDKYLIDGMGFFYEWEGASSVEIRQNFVWVSTDLLRDAWGEILNVTYSKFVTEKNIFLNASEELMNGHLVTGGASGTIRENLFVGPYVPAISLEATHGTNILGNKFIGVEVGVRAKDTESILENNTFVSSGQGIAFQNARINFSQNIFWGCREAVVVEWGPAGGTLEKNWFQKNQIGIHNPTADPDVNLGVNSGIFSNNGTAILGEGIVVSEEVLFFQNDYDVVVEAK